MVNLRMIEKDLAKSLYTDANQFRENLRQLLEHQEEMVKDIRFFMERIDTYIRRLESIPMSGQNRRPETR